MSYEKAFEAVKNGDFYTAVPLLNQAAEETGFASHIINNAYTLALYSAGEKARLADVAFRIGQSLVEADPASAMDYFQRAIVAGLSADHLRKIGQIFDGWAAPARDAHLKFPVHRVAHFVSCLIPGQTVTEYLKMLARSLRLQGIESTVFTTEATAAWFYSPTRRSHSQPLDFPGEVRIGGLEGDFVDRADRLCDAVQSAEFQATFFHEHLGDQIAARVASMRPSPVQVAINYGTDIDADLFDGRIHLFENSLKRARYGSKPAEWVPLTSDVESRLRICEPLTRQAMGLESAATISATFGGLDNAADRNYIRALSEVMKRFPKHFHMFAGSGNVRAIRSQLHSEGVLPRVRFLGDVKDVTPLLNVIDVYLASFPETNAQSILEAMSAGKPVAVLRFPQDSPHNAAAELVGSRELTAPGEANYIEITDRLLRDSAFRAEMGETMRNRFHAEFRPERLGERYKQFLARFQRANA